MSDSNLLPEDIGNSNPLPQFFCAFPEAVGLDRVLKMQRFVSPSKEDDRKGIMYSWPVPDQRFGLSCNVVILGKPGTGKSTLALEMASRLKIVKAEADGGQLKPRAEKPGEPATVLFYSLEQQPKSLKLRHRTLDPETAVVHEGPSVDDAMWGQCARCDGPTGKNPGGQLCRACRRNKQGEADPLNVILFPQLSPRKLEQTGEKPDESSVFWHRLSEIRNLVEKLERLQKREPQDPYGLPKLRMVIIDSLNVFGDRPISRYLIEQLFSFFVEKGLIGVFVAEDPETAAKTVTEEPHISPGIANLADVVIKMQWKTDEGYSSRSMEVEKSRFTSNVYGIQQMKMRARGVEVLPSIHSWYSFFTECPDGPTNKRDPKNRLKFRLSEMDQILDSKGGLEGVPSIVYTLTGPKDSCKTPIAISYALASAGDLTCSSDDAAGSGKFLLVSLDLSPVANERAGSFGSYTLHADEQEHKGFEAGKLIGRTKGRLSRMCLDNQHIGYQLWLAPGFLLAEELVHYLYEMLRHPNLKDVTRVVVQDIGLVPMRYPVIFRHINQHGNLFTVIMELLRKLGVDCMFVCGSVDESAVKVAKSLMSVSHCTIRTEREEPSAIAIPIVRFGGRYVDNGEVKRHIQPCDTKKDHYELIACET